MRIKLKYLEVHKGQTVFLKGNLGEKLMPKNRAGMIMERDMEDGSVYISYQGEVLILERTSVFSWAPEDNKDVGFTNLTTAPVKLVHSPSQDELAAQAQSRAKGFKSAQVSTPADAAIHLQAAPKYVARPAKTAPVDPNDVKKS